MEKKEQSLAHLSHALLFSSYINQCKNSTQNSTLIIKFLQTLITKKVLKKNVNFVRSIFCFSLYVCMSPTMQTLSETEFSPGKIVVNPLREWLLAREKNDNDEVMMENIDR